MKVDKKELDNRKVEFTVELSPEEIKPYLDKAVKKISQEVNIPGFRKGKVPYDILKQNVGEATIYEEAFHDIVNKTLPDIVDKEKIDFVGQPKVDAEKIAPGNPLVYKATFALMPTIKLGDYKTLKSKPKKVEADEEKVKKTFADMQKMYAKEKVVDRAVKKGDKVEIDFNIKLAGVAIEGGSAKNYPLVIGDNMFIPGFEDNLIDLKKADKKEFKVTFPKEYHDKKVAGRECDVICTLHAVYDRELPKLDDDFAKQFNFKSWQDMDKQIRDNIKKEVEQKEKQRFELAILEEIMEKSTFDPIPDEMMDIEMQKMMHELKHNVEDSGGTMEDYLNHIKKSEDDLKKDFKPNAIKRIKTALIAKAVCQAEEIKVSDKEVEQELSKNKAQYKDQPEMKEQLESPEYKRYLKNILLNQKTFARLESFV